MFIVELLVWLLQKKQEPDKKADEPDKTFDDFMFMKWQKETLINSKKVRKKKKCCWKEFG